jgi:hypothetical protein
MNFIRYLMEIFYNGEKFVKYKYSKGNYFISIVMTIFVLFVLLFFAFTIASILIPSLREVALNVSDSVPSWIFGIAFFAIFYVGVRFLIPENTIRELDFSKEELKRRRDRIIFSIYFLVLFTGALLLMFFREKTS